MIKNPNVAVIIPVYNEMQVITRTIKEASDFFSLIICVNDGSVDKTAEAIRKSVAVLVEHPINMGQGAALQTGIEFALQYPQVEYLVTYDADGQHNIEDVKNMLETIKKENADIVVGSRFLGKVLNMPLSKRFILKLAIHFTNVFSGVSLTDTHNGLRVFNRKFGENINITMAGMAHASEIIDKMGRGNWSYVEVPVTIRYSEYSRHKGQSILNSVNILMDILFSKARK